MGLCIPQGIKSKLPGEDSELLQTTFPFPPAFFLPLFICPLLTYPSLTCCQGQGQLGALPLCFLSPGSPLSLQGGGCCSYISLQDLAQAHFIPDVSVSTPPRNLNAVLCVTSFFCFKKNYVILEYSRLTTLWSFQVDSKGTQPYINMYPLHFSLEHKEESRYTIT